MSATRRGALRVADDAYYTPLGAIISLSTVLNDREGLAAFEPCWGNGAIPNALQQFKWSGVDINGDKSQDYLKTALNVSPDLIITNPPFCLAQEFLTKSLEEAEVVVYLLRLNFLGSQKRKMFWKANPPTHLFPLSRRPSFTGGGTDATDYAWFGWDKAGGILGDPRIEVI